MPPHKPYHWLAQYYDEMFQALHGPTDAARNRLLRPILKRVTSACDLACGTGTTAITLARQGLEVCGVDASPDMCRLARQKVARTGLPISILHADMRDFRLKAPVDLITCECDAINHVPRKSDLRKVARAVFRALRPGGHFYFDVNNSLGFTRYWTGTIFHETAHVAMLMRNGHNPKADRAWCEIDWFVRDSHTKHLYRRHQERVDEVCWTPAEIDSTFTAAGFDPPRHFDAAPYFKVGNPLTTPGCRSFYLVRKPLQSSE